MAVPARMTSTASSNQGQTGGSAWCTLVPSCVVFEEAKREEARTRDMDCALCRLMIGKAPHVTELKAGSTFWCVTLPMIKQLTHDNTPMQLRHRSALKLLEHRSHPQSPKNLRRVSRKD